MANSFIFNETTYSTGDRVKVHLNIQEEGKARTQIFEGLIIAIKNRGKNRSFTVRKIAAGGIGVERIIPLHSPILNKIERRTKGDVRRAKLYYLRGRVGRKALRVRETKKDKKSVQASTQKTGEKGRKSSQKAASK